MRTFKIENSSNVKSIGYSPETQVMTIEFATAIYEYANITPDIAGAVAFASSVGAALNAWVKPYPAKYPFKKIPSEVQA